MILPTQRNQEGLASIVVVTVLIVLLSLISLGFAKIMSRSVANSTNRQLSSEATYAVQSGINDVVKFMTDYARDSSHSASPWVRSDHCRDLIDRNPASGAAGRGPFIEDKNIGTNTVLNCILLNPTPTDLTYTAVPELKSQVIKLTSSAFSGSLNAMMVSWQATNGHTGTPASCCNLNDEIAWNDDTNSYVPMLRMTLYPVPVNTAAATLDYLQSHAKTVFLYPQRPGASITNMCYAPSTNPCNVLSDGQILPVSCNGPGVDPNFSGSADYQCNVIIKNLMAGVAPGDQLNYYYVRLTPIYGQSDIKIKINDFWQQQLQFIGSQAIVDVTATTANVSKRLQARVDTSSILSNEGGNESALDNNIPEDSLRSATNLCKRAILHNSYYQYVTLGDPNGVCSAGGINILAPTLHLDITGLDGIDAGRTVDSEAVGRPGQNPPYNGTVYVDGNARIHWHTTDAPYYCNAAPAQPGWSGDVYQPPYRTTWTGTTADGSTSVANGRVTDYTLTCAGPGSPTPLTKTVKLWPPPQVDVSGPATVRAGEGYTISLRSFNVKEDVNGPCILSGDWSGTVGHNYDQGFVWPYNDNTSTRRYIATCYDPSGRWDRDEQDVSAISCPPSGCTQVLPPNCTADVSISDNGNGTASFSWNGACPDYNASLGYYQLINCAGFTCDSIAPGGWVGNAAGPFQTGFGYGITYCLQLRSGVDPWGWLAQSARKCATTTPPPLTVSTGVWGTWHQPTCDGDTNHFYCAAAQISGTDPTGDSFTCYMYMGSPDYRIRTVSGGGGYAGELFFVGWPFDPTGEGYWGQCVGTYGRDTGKVYGGSVPSP